MKKTTLTCDGCNKPIEGKPGWPKNDYVSVSLAPITDVESVGFTYAVAVRSYLTREYQFHNVLCLSKWDKIEEMKNLEAEAKKVVDNKKDV